MANGRTLLGQRRFAPLFLTQLLGAFNDNLLKSALIVAITFGGLGRAGLSVDALVNAASALLVLPFFLFSAIAGQLADKLEKSRLVRILKITELCIMVLAAVGFGLESVPMLLTALFLMGTQSAFFGPLKYGILPQHLETRELVSANGLVEMGTFVAILGGTMVGGLVIALGDIGVIALAALAIVVALAGWMASRCIPLAPAGAPELRIDWNFVRGTRDTLRIAKKDRRVHRSILGASWFWFVGALVLAQFPIFAKDVLGGDETTVTLLLAVFSVGIGVGSVACDKIMRGKVELWLVPTAGVLMTLFLGDLGWSTLAAGAHVDARVVIDLFMLGASGGLFVVPLYAIMQKHAGEESRSRVIAGNNILNAGFMVAAAAIAIGLRAAGLSIPAIFVLTAAANAIVALAIGVLVHRHVVRAIVGTVVRAIYRVRVEGLDAIPDDGPALLVCNHASFADALIVGGLCRRPVRFVMYHRIFDVPVLGWLFRLVQAIPIAPKSEDPARLEAAYDEIDAALADDEVVCVFPEGKITTDGEIDTFRPGIERILGRRPVTVVPLALRGLYGSVFSKRPTASVARELFREVELVAGAAMEPEHASAEALRAEVVELRGDKR